MKEQVTSTESGFPNLEILAGLKRRGGAVGADQTDRKSVLKELRAKMLEHDELIDLCRGETKEKLLAFLDKQQERVRERMVRSTCSSISGAADFALAHAMNYSVLEYLGNLKVAICHCEAWRDTIGAQYERLSEAGAKEDLPDMDHL